ncbi:MAG: hypothetical protein Q8S13_09210 [Dehalococcoidia bacterium]|nr:hypothetical protein [Dehalococcoidia bacterium]
MFGETMPPHDGMPLFGAQMIADSLGRIFGTGMDLVARAFHESGQWRRLRLLDRGMPPGCRRADTCPAGSFPIGIGEKVSLLELPRGPDNAAEVLSVVVTGDVDIDAPTSPGGGALARPTAKILFGIGGVQSEVIVDALRGFVFQAPMSYLQVIGINDAIPATIGGAAVSGRAIRMGAFAGYGIGAGSSQLTLTRFIDAVSAIADQTFTLRVPQFGRTFVAERSPATSDMTVNFLDEANNPVGEIEIAGNARMTVETLPSDCRFVDLMLAAGTQTGRGIFGLQVG